MKLSFYIGKIINNFEIKFIKDNENDTEIRLKCTNCNCDNIITIKRNRIGRINCKNCNNKKIIVINRLKNEIDNIKIITEHLYNTIVKKYNSFEVKDVSKYDFIINTIFIENLFNEDMYFNKVNNLFEDVKETKEVIVKDNRNKKYNLDNNGITFKKIEKKIENNRDTMEEVDKSGEMIDRLIKESNENFYFWCKNNGELGELVIRLFSKRKNTKRLEDISSSSKEEIWFNRGELRGLFSNTPYNITNEYKIRHKLPNRYSYNKLFIYNYFSLIYKVELNKEIFDKKVDIYIDEIKLALIYVGTTFNYERDIDSIRDKLNYNDIRTIVIDGTHLKNNLELIDDTITFKGNNKGKNIDNVLYDICSIVLKEYDMRSSTLPDMGSIIRKMGLIY